MEFIQPKTITAYFKMPTPMFIGNAEQKADDKHMRNASLKGAIRFWWRATRWGHLAEKLAIKDALAKLHEEEALLFGSAESETGKQSLFILTSEFSRSPKLYEAGSKDLRHLSYLLGMGLYSHKTGLLRSRLELDEGELIVKFRFKPSTKPVDASVEQLIVAIKALGFFGGLGSRARKGFGSLALQRIEYQDSTQTFNTLEDIQAFIKTLNFSATNDSPLSAFSQGSRIDISAEANASMTLLNSINHQLHSYRDGTDRNEERENNFPNDRVIAKKAAQNQTVTEVPQRSVFGLPHNYQWKQDNNKLDVTVKEEQISRRASPLFVHIHAFPDGKCVAIQSLLPTLFLPQGVKIDMKGKKVEARINYQVIHTYLNRFEQRKELRNGR
ncbi:type III-B CRISPR module RAMP protein Cmr1 [Pseudomonas sp. F1_0610]|uniref:type III-B CRISPR module RAMP protein Cmr1 n=1 Tax=Pseudomonas sp. F1_0610 TaxID=3114284 RepID=UPI0039C45805